MQATQNSFLKRNSGENLTQDFPRPLSVAPQFRAVPLVQAGEDGELGGQGVVKPLHQTVTLGMERRRPRLVHPAGRPLQRPGIQSSAPGRCGAQQGPRNGQTSPPAASLRWWRSLVRHRIRLRPFGEVVHGHEDIVVAGVGDWEWPQDVDPHPLHRCSH